MFSLAPADRHWQGQPRRGGLRGTRSRGEPPLGGRTPRKSTSGQVGGAREAEAEVTKSLLSLQSLPLGAQMLKVSKSAFFHFENKRLSMCTPIQIVFRGRTEYCTPIALQLHWFPPPLWVHCGGEWVCLLLENYFEWRIKIKSLFASSTWNVVQEHDF